MLFIIVFVCITSSIKCSELDFPAGFKIGAMTSAYQVEGAWNTSEKSPNTWDQYNHDHHTEGGDTASDSYHYWKRDVEVAKELGLKIYRFSISWSRLLPTSFPNQINEDARGYYNNLINGLIENNIEPMVTLYHFDLPQRLQYLGGWTNPLITDWFSDYARAAYTLFGDRVKLWITFNEPFTQCVNSYTLASFPPSVKDPFYGQYLCDKHSLLAHGKAWRVYDEEFRWKQHGKVSISNLMTWFDPLTSADEELTNLVMEYTLDRYNHPIYSKQGGWPINIERLIEKKSFEQGLPWSRLPKFTDEEKSLLKGTYDFFAMSSGSTRIVRALHQDEELTFPYEGSEELNAAFLVDQSWTDSADSWSKLYAPSTRKHLYRVKKLYNNPEVIVSAGIVTKGYELADVDRKTFFNDTLRQVLLSIHRDNVNVTTFLASNLIDGYEWNSSYVSKTGLYQVDFHSAKKTRTARSSAIFLRDVICSQSINGSKCASSSHKMVFNLTLMFLALVFVMRM